MTYSWPILSLVTFLPLFGAGLILFFIPGNDEVGARNARYVALWASLVTFLVSLGIWFGFERGTAEFQFVERVDWIPSYNIAYHMGVDGISMPFVLLSTLLTPICILSAWDAIKTRVKEYMIAFLVLETLMVGMFCALDFVGFYIFFEAVLIPMFLIIGIWGGSNRVYAAFKFFLYTLLGSVLMLIAIMTMYLIAGTTDIPTLMTYRFDPSLQTWLWLALFASFAVKVPMWPVHTWLPDAHVQAPTAGSVILAGVLLKMGAYGFLRFSLPILPDATEFFTPMVFALSLIAVVYTSLVALAQEDMKKLIAYSSVAHMGYVTAGIFTLNQQGLEGAIFQMISHGLVSGALFLIVGVVYDRLHTRDIAAYGGLADNMPKYALIFMLFTMASAGLPGTAGFVGEFLVIIGAFQVNTWVGLIIASGMVLGAAYMLVLYRKTVFGELTKDNVRAMLDLNAREKAVFLPLVILTILFGVYPLPLLDVMSASVSNLINNYELALAATDAASTTQLGALK
ncbi:NADH-quinone oxidoreductase subunit M [Rhodovibrionaceae bacterium A322]